jgi:hypothetical protein
MKRLLPLLLLFSFVVPASFASAQSLAPQLLDADQVQVKSVARKLKSSFLSRLSRRHYSPRTNLRVAITSPNGGETWKAGSKETITWDYKYTKMLTNVKEFDVKASLFLIHGRRGSLSRRHIADVKLADRKYTWAIPADVRSSKGYRVLIVVTGNRCKVTTSSDKRCSAVHIARDASNGSFKIIGENGVIKPMPKPKPKPKPMPKPKPIPMPKPMPPKSAVAIEKKIDLLQSFVERIEARITQLREMLANL